jgi:hypothetical protein
MKKKENKECKIVCDGKDVAKISCSENGFSVKRTAEGKKMQRDDCGCGCY